MESSSTGLTFNLPRGGWEIPVLLLPVLIGTLMASQGRKDEHSADDTEMQLSLPHMSVCS